ncbi:MAG: CheY-like chemotaxis protein [Candidatus Omnitrophota bacterium]|jgi:CheY-like chemotaxis protein
MKMLLVIGDEKKILKMFDKLLRMEGFHVVTASNVEDATEIVIRGAVDLALLDIRMPEINGKTMYEVIREYDTLIKVLVTSVFSLGNQKRMIVGAQGYHDKAHGNAVLLKKIQEVLCL